MNRFVMGCYEIGVLKITSVNFLRNIIYTLRISKTPKWCGTYDIVCVVHHNGTIGLMNPNEPSVLQLNALIDHPLCLWYSSGITINIQDQLRLMVVLFWYSFFNESWFHFITIVVYFCMKIIQVLFF